jgi:hypothetical protein
MQNRRVPLHPRPVAMGAPIASKDAIGQLVKVPCGKLRRALRRAPALRRPIDVARCETPMATITGTRRHSMPAVSMELMFPLEYHALGDCLAHPNKICNCAKVSRMQNSQSQAWQELGRRFRIRVSERPAATEQIRTARRTSCFEFRGQGRERQSGVSPSVDHGEFRRVISLPLDSNRAKCGGPPRRVQSLIDATPPKTQETPSRAAQRLKELHELALARVLATKTPADKLIVAAAGSKELSTPIGIRRVFRRPSALRPDG